MKRAVLLLFLGCASTSEARPSSPLGTNLVAMKSYSGEWVWKDAFHQAAFWRSESQPGVEDPRPLRYGKDGWITSLEPGQRAVARLFAVDGMSFPSGVYSVSWEGSGTVVLEGGRVIGTQARGAQLHVAGTPGGFAVVITATDPKNPIKNIKALMPGGTCANDDHAYCARDPECGASVKCVPFAQTVDRLPFHPTFLASNEPYSVLRFMHWGDTIGSEVRTWSERPPLNGSMWTPLGVPYELMVDLSNHLKTDMWITIPPLADDDFVRQLATLLKTKLDPALKVYVEYGNEIWNGAYPDGAMMGKKGLELGLSKDPWEAMLKYYSKRAIQMFEIFSKVMPDRIVRVLAGQSANERVAQIELEGIGPDSIDAFAIAPYFGDGLGSEKALTRVLKSTPDEIVAALEKDFVPEAIAGVKRHATLLAKLDKGRKKPIDLIAYEGGQHLVGIGPVQNEERVTKLFLEANRSPKMKKVYLDYLAAWKASGGGLFMHFVHTRLPTKWGAFGLIDKPGDKSPKLDAVLTYIRENPR